MSKVKIFFLTDVDSFWKDQSGMHSLKTDRNNLENGDIFFSNEKINYYLYYEDKLMEVPIGTAIVRF